MKVDNNKRTNKQIMSSPLVIDLCSDSEDESSPAVAKLPAAKAKVTKAVRSPIKLRSYVKVSDVAVAPATPKKVVVKHVPDLSPVVVAHGFGYGNLGDTYNFKVLGDPMAQPRPRFTMRQCKNGNQKGIIYDCETAKKAKNNVAAQLKAHFPTVVYKGDQPVEMVIVAHMKRPNYHFIGGQRDSSKIKEGYQRANPAVIKKDVDNISKFYMDACNKVLYDDDKQVTQLQVTKLYDNKLDCAGRTEIVVGEYDLYSQFQN